MFVFKATFSILLLSAVMAVVGYRYGFADIAGHLQQLSVQIVAVTIFGLLANAMIAVFRFQVLASDAGHPIGFRRAMAAVGAGSIAGALFFQIAGQLMARGVVMRRGGVPFSAVVVVTLYERGVAALVSGLIAVLGAVHIFGRIYLDQSAGGGQLVKIVCGLAAAIGMAGFFGFGDLARQHAWPLLTRQTVLRFLRVAGLTVLVQLPMMGVYVALAHEFSPHTPMIDLVAASAIVMFAASVPISLAGWGVREFSAVMALGAIGMSASGALTTAIIIGAGSLLAMGAVFALSFNEKPQGVVAAEQAEIATIDYAKALGWVVPLAAAVFVLFQIYVPVGSGLLNVNLADPVAILGGSLFVLHAMSNRRLPQWRARHVNLFGLLATLAIGASLLIGASRFGWTNWALVNRFIGWFVLLGYAATGALIGTMGHSRALRIFALSGVGAAVGIILVEIALVLVNATGLHTGSLVTPNAIEGFAQNRNAFAFQLLMALGGAIVFLEGKRSRFLVFSLFIAALWFAGSRSGWISLAGLFAVAVHLRRAGVREIAKSVVLAVFVAAVVLIAQTLSGTVSLPELLPNVSSTAERLESLVAGWKMFMSHPIFGAGLGAFNHLDIRTMGGIPLVIHSTALWLLAELGLAGFFIFAIAGISIWRSSWRRAPIDAASALIALSFVTFAIMSGPADMMYQRIFWLVAGAALALPRLMPSEASATIAPSPG